MPTSTGTYNYDAYTFQNASATTATCVTVTVSHPCDQNSDTIQFVAYLGSFDPTAPAANLAGKTGFGFCQPSPASFSFNLPAGATFQVVLFASGVESGPYTLVVDGTGEGVIWAPTAVTVRTVTASLTRRGVLVRWRTGTQTDLLGFHVYRSLGHSWRRISQSMIPAKTSVAGASYRFLDKTARRGVSYRYRIKAIAQDGTSTWFGPIRAT